MDLIIELLKAIVAAFEGKKAETPIPSSDGDDESNALREEIAATQRRIAEKQEVLRQQREAGLAAHAAAAAHAHPARRAGKTHDASADSPRVTRGPAHAQRLARLLRQPHTARELIIFSELLGPPKAMRRGHR